MAKQGQKRPKEFEINITQDDFSQQAINRALLKHAFSRNSFRYPLFGFLLAILGLPLVGWSSFLLAMMFFSLGLSTLSLLWNYLIRSDQFLHQHMDNLQKALQYNTDRKMAKLKQELKDHQRASIQIDQVDRVFDNLTEILEHKFDTSELTYKRYYGMAQEVFLSSIDNLNEITLSLKSIEEIDRYQINNRLSKLDENDALDKQEIGTLNRRLALLDSTEQKIRTLLIENEKAMTLMNETAIEIAKIDVNDQEGKVDMENSMKQLAEMITHSQDYSL